MTASGFDPSDSHDPGARGPAGFTTQEVFSNIVEFESFIKRMIPTLIMLFLVTAPMVKTQVKQNLGGQDPERAQTGVILTHFDKEWETGRIGQWIRAYRPDLLP